MDTVAVGRAKRSTAGNRMRELLEKAHQQDDDELFKEEEGDEEFAAPTDQRDVFLEDFADTDEEVELDDEDEERAIRREERRKAKGKSKVYNPLAPTTVKPKKVKFPPEPSAASSSTGPGTKTGKRAEDQELLDPNIDASIMAKSTLVLALRKQRREQKRLHRDETLRSSLRASTLRTEEDILEKEKAEKSNTNRKGRLAQHVTGEIRVVRKMTQDELIAAALEEEERNKESLRDWLKKEEERRELRRVGRKRVRGPRWTWVSRTVGKLVEEIEDDPAKAAASRNEDTPMESTPAPAAAESVSTATDQPINASDNVTGISTESEPVATVNAPTDTLAETSSDTVPTATKPADSSTLPPEESDSITACPPVAVLPEATNQAASTTVAAPPVQPVEATSASDQPIPVQPEPVLEGPSQYTRNYIILSQIPGGLARELQLVLGDHVEWDQVKYIPHRNRPLTRRVTICPFTGQRARYRHPSTLTPYASIDGYRQIESLLSHRYVWDEGSSVWFSGEEDVGAEGVEDIAGWREAVHGGWIGGREVPPSYKAEDDGDVIMAPRKGAKKRFFDEIEAENPNVKVKRGKSKRGKGRRG